MPIGEAASWVLALIMTPILLWNGVRMLRKWAQLRKVYEGTDKYDHRHLYVGAASLYAPAMLLLCLNWQDAWPSWLTGVLIAPLVPLFAAIIVLDRARSLPYQKDFDRRNTADKDE
jgi:hypothetical protein